MPLLELVSIDALAVVDDPLVSTELHVVVHNPSIRPVDGAFAVPVPVGAEIRRVTVTLDGETYDVGLTDAGAAPGAAVRVERGAGNVLVARVSWVPGDGEVEVVVASVAAVHDAAWTLPLRGLPRAPRLDARVLVVGVAAPLREVHASDVLPDDLRVLVEPGGDTTARSGDVVAVRVRPRLDRDEAPIDGLTVLLDTSGSRAPGFAGQVDRLGLVLEAIREVGGRDVPLDVLCFDQGVEPCYSGTIAGFDASARAAIAARGALGASDLGLALAAAPATNPRVLVVGDGVVTAGIDGDGLRAAATALGDRGVVRIDALVDGGIRDEAVLRALVGAAPSGGMVLDAAATPGTIAARLATMAVDGVQAGDDVVLVAKAATTAGRSSVPMARPAPEADATVNGDRADDGRPVVIRCDLGGLDDSATAMDDVIRSHVPALQACYDDRLREDPDLGGRIEVEWTVEAGIARNVRAYVDTTGDPGLAACLTSAIATWEFPASIAGDVAWPFLFRRRERSDLDEVRWLIADGRTVARGLAAAQAWHDRAPSDALALVALGEALEASKRPADAARAYGSILDLPTAGADLPPGTWP
jgi:hypothetical protein